jgi:hypothetical protein
LVAISIALLSCNLTRVTPAAPTSTAGPASPKAQTTDTPEPTPGPGVIRGILWHDICQFTGGEGGELPVLGEGCVRWGTHVEQFGPNQEQDDFETGWAGVTLHLGAGACPASGLAVAVTDSEGRYQFGNLAAGTYCVSYDPLADGNDSILIPGGPTYPIRGEAGLAQTVLLAAGETKDVNFGFAWQFYN